jgi:hypothetical protein
MFRAFFLFLALPLNAQLLVNTYAGGVIRTGVPANSVPLGILSGIAWDPSGNIVFSDTTYNVIRRVDTDGMIETIVGTGVTGFAGDGGPATSALINRPASPVYDSSGNLYFFDSENYRIPGRYERRHHHHRWKRADLHHGRGDGRSSDVSLLFEWAPLQCRPIRKSLSRR